MSMRTSRIGLLSVHAHAPVIDGHASIADGEVTLTFVVAINEVSTGNPLLDPEVHALVNSGSDGRLTFTGTGASLAEVTGHASAGNVTVPLELAARPQSGDPQLPLELTGKTTFRNIHLPLPGMGHISHVDIDIEGLVTLMRSTADS
jgi:hypothetical protein